MHVFKFVKRGRGWECENSMSAANTLFRQCSTATPRAQSDVLRTQTKGAEKLPPEFSCSFRFDRLSAAAAAPS